MTAPARTIVIIPAYNEEESLPAVLKELREQTPDYDVLVVSDGSIDRNSPERSGLDRAENWFGGSWWGGPDGLPGTPDERADAVAQ